MFLNFHFAVPVPTYKDINSLWRNKSCSKTHFEWTYYLASHQVFRSGEGLCGFLQRKLYYCNGTTTIKLFFKKNVFWFESVCSLFS